MKCVSCYPIPATNYILHLGNARHVETKHVQLKIAVWKSIAAVIPSIAIV